ncbi:AmmeMemoRadiSam system protein B [Symbiobacterium terraclitae]|uniref:AmmeMemoRadiSam system protein B n=1 Tax=Symbiobacterium terraclitae TaxID=557451 RepID=A0ABS4JUJ4_9FIRM|nr:AmmeMemoRadiSam system protein B [Symbiobacterium terraclitae]
MVGRRQLAAALVLVIATGLLGLAGGPPGSARGPLGLAGAGDDGPSPVAPEPDERLPAAPEPAQPNVFFNPKLFYGGLEAARGAAATVAGPLAGGLVPHHDLAAELLSGFFLQLEAEPPEVIFLVGPNHDAAGQPVITGRRSWQTDFGLVEADRAAVDALVAAGLAAVDEAVLAREHSMGTLMPYIKYHAPGARVVPLVLHRNLTLPELKRLADGLAEQLGPGRILVASVDFSHYLTRAEAEARDEETLAAVMAGDLDRLLGMGNDHLDSPGAVAVLLMAMEASGAEGPAVLGHTNSGRILRDDLVETTSYFTFVFVNGDGAKEVSGPSLPRDDLAASPSSAAALRPDKAVKPQVSQFVVVTGTDT